MEQPRQGIDSEVRFNLWKQYLGHGSEWRPMRYCEDDWVLCVWLWRSSRTRLDIGLFVAEDHYRFVKDAGVMGGLVFLFSEAYNKLGQMEVHFVGPPHGHEPEVPASIRRVTSTLGIEIQGRSVITDAEGRQIYARLTGLSAESERILKARGIDLTRTCFVAQRRIWSPPEIEYIVNHADSPERLFEGGVAQERRLSFLHDLLVLRIALMSERVRTLFQNEGEKKGATVVKTTWTSATGQSVESNQEVLIPSLTQITYRIKKNEPLSVILCPRDAIGFAMFPRMEGPTAQMIVVTKDLVGLRTAERDRWIKSWGENRIILPIVDTLEELDEEINKRLARASSTARAMPELRD